MENVCPVCGKDDRIKKVSAIVQLGISHSTGQMPVGYSYTGTDGKVHSAINYENFSATQISTIARMLLPPPKPKLPGGAYLRGSLSFLALIFLCIGISIVALSRGGNKEAIGMSIIASVMFLGASIVSAVLLFLAFLWNRNQKRTFETNMPMWEKAIQRWEKLYYCERDDLIYVPEEMPVQISKMMGYLNWRPILE